MTTDPMYLQRVRIGTQTWADLGEAAPRGNRSALIRQLLAWYLRRPEAPLPERPIRPSPNTCGIACSETHMYEGDCLAHPMLIGATRSHTEGDVTEWSWICSYGPDCEGLRHLGYPSLPAARRAYDRHMKAEHGLSAP